MKYEISQELDYTSCTTSASQHPTKIILEKQQLLVEGTKQMGSTTPKFLPYLGKGKQQTNLARLIELSRGANQADISAILFSLKH